MAEIKTPATLTPEDPDAVIFATMAAQRWLSVHDIGGAPAIWSRPQERWLHEAEYAAEWRHQYRYRAVMGDEDTVRALNDYERMLGL